MPSAWHKHTCLKSQTATSICKKKMSEKPNGDKIFVIDTRHPFICSFPQSHIHWIKTKPNQTNKKKQTRAPRVWWFLRLGSRTEAWRLRQSMLARLRPSLCVLCVHTCLCESECSCVRACVYVCVQVYVLYVLYLLYVHVPYAFIYNLTCTTSNVLRW